MASNFFSSNNKEVIVKTISGMEFKLSVEDETTIANLKDELAKKLDFSKSILSLLFYGQKLSDDKKVSDFNLRDNILVLDIFKY
jgi:hypothetical protein